MGWSMSPANSLMHQELSGCVNPDVCHILPFVDENDSPGMITGRVWCSEGNGVHSTMQVRLSIILDTTLLGASVNFLLPDPWICWWLHRSPLAQPWCKIVLMRNRLNLNIYVKGDQQDAPPFFKSKLVVYCIPFLTKSWEWKLPCQLFHSCLPGIRDDAVLMYWTRGNCGSNPASGVFLAVSFRGKKERKPAPRGYDFEITYHAKHASPLVQDGIK